MSMLTGALGGLAQAGIENADAVLEERRKLRALQFQINETKTSYTSAVKQTAVLAGLLIFGLSVISFVLVRWLTARLHNPLNRITALSREYA